MALNNNEYVNYYVYIYSTIYTIHSLWTLFIELNYLNANVFIILLYFIEISIRIYISRKYVIKHRKRFHKFVIDIFSQ